MNLLAESDQGDDNRPAWTPGHDFQHQLRFASRATVLERHSLTVPGTLRFIEHYNVLRRYIRSSFEGVVVQERMDVLNKGGDFSLTFLRSLPPLLKIA
jgi:hypothetical protein